jgi:hypothetical protein
MLGEGTAMCQPSSPGGCIPQVSPDAVPGKSPRFLPGAHASVPGTSRAYAVRMARRRSFFLRMSATQHATARAGLGEG